MMNNTRLKVFAACCASAFLMEILMARAPQCAMFITFLQFIFITLQGLIFTSRFGSVKPKIPKRQYALLVALYFLTSVANNYVYSLHVHSTLHMIIRSASTPASMIVYWHAKKKPPKLRNALGSIFITIGVATAMYGGASVVDQKEGKYLEWCIGVAILLLTLITGAYTGLLQEQLFTKYGKQPDEMLFYTNALPLPFFLLVSPHLWQTAHELTIDTWSLIGLNIISQFYCAGAVHKLASEETTVTITLILTLRKFMSLLISAVVFNNKLTVLHVIGTSLVVLGTYIYFNFSMRKQQSVKYESKRD